MPSAVARCPTGEGFQSFHAVDVRLGANGAESGAGLVTQGECSGHRRSPGFMCGGAEHVVEEEGARFRRARDRRVLRRPRPDLPQTEIPPSDSWWTTNGGAKAVRSPMTALRARDWPSTDLLDAE